MTNQLNLGRAYSLASSNYSYIDCVKCQISSHLIRGGGLLCFYCELLLRANLTINVYVTGQNYIQVKIFQPRLIFNLAVSPSPNYL